MDKIAAAILCVGLVACGVFSEVSGGNPSWIWVGAVIAFFGAC